MLHKIVDMIDDQPCFAVPLAQILASCEAGGAVQILSPLEHHTSRQRAWYRGVCLRGLSDWSGDTLEEWDYRLKVECGGDLLHKETIYFGTLSDGQKVTVERLTIVGVGKKNMTAYIERILEKAIEKDWPVTPPESELRSR